MLKNLEMLAKRWSRNHQALRVQQRAGLKTVLPTPHFPEHTRKAIPALLRCPACPRHRTATHAQHHRCSNEPEQRPSGTLPSHHGSATRRCHPCAKQPRRNWPRGKTLPGLCPLFMPIVPLNGMASKNHVHRSGWTTTPRPILLIKNSQRAV